MAKNMLTLVHFGRTKTSRTAIIKNELKKQRIKHKLTIRIIKIKGQEGNITPIFPLEHSPGCFYWVHVIFCELL